MPSATRGEAPPNRSRAALALAFVILGVGASARAQELNYNTFLIGTRAMGMGGAFTGVADDPSSAFHNPAGLGLMLRSATSANLSVIAIEGWKMEGGYGSIAGPRDLEHDAIPSLPLFVGFGQKFGSEDAHGIHQHGIALSIVRPAQIRRRFEVNVFDEVAGFGDSIRIDHEESSQWYGVSYGVRLEPGFALGIGGWLALRDVEHREEQFTARGIIPAGASRTADRLMAQQNEATVSTIGLVFRIGLLWHIDSQWSFGAMLQPGAISITNGATLSARSGRTGTGIPPAVEDLRFIEQEDLSGDLPLPWQLRVGASHRFTPDYRMALDLAVYAPIGSESDPVDTFGGEVDPVTGEVPSPGQFIAREWYANMTANVALGFDAMIADLVPLQAGVFTDFSAAPGIDGPSPVYRSPQVHGFGASVAGGIHRGDFDVQVGAAGVFGWGTGLGTNPDANAPVSERYLPRSVERYTLYFFISGTERAAESLVRELLREIDLEELLEEEAEQEVEQLESEEEAIIEEEVTAGPPPPLEAPGPNEALGIDNGRRAAIAPLYLRSPWRDLATE